MRRMAFALVFFVVLMGAGLFVASSAAGGGAPSTIKTPVIPPAHIAPFHQLPLSDRMAVRQAGQTKQDLVLIATVRSALLSMIPPSPTPTTQVTESTPTTPTTTVPVPSPTVSSASGDTLVAEWYKVAVCEEGGWIGYASQEFPDSLGIDSDNWFASGGGSDLSPETQAEVGQTFADKYLGGEPPDQDGCDGSY